MRRERCHIITPLWGPHGALPECSRACKYRGDLDVGLLAPESVREVILTFLQYFRIIFGIPFGVLLAHFPASVQASNRCRFEGPSGSNSGPGSDPQRCSGSCKYRGQLDVARFAPGKLLGGWDAPGSILGAWGGPSKEPHGARVDDQFRVSKKGGRSSHGGSTGYA